MMENVFQQEEYSQELTGRIYQNIHKMNEEELDEACHATKEWKVSVQNELKRVNKRLAGIKQRSSELGLLENLNEWANRHGINFEHKPTRVRMEDEPIPMPNIAEL